MLRASVTENFDPTAVAVTGGTIDGTTIGATVASSAKVTTLAASGAITANGSVALSPVSSNVVLSPTGTGVVTINPATVGAADNMVVGANTAKAGTFTALIATVSSALKGLILGTGAAAGNIGEVLTSTLAAGSPITLSNGVAANITSFSITAGNWLVWGMVDYALTGVTATFFQSGCSITSATLPTQPGGSGLGSDSLIDVPLLTTALSSTYGQQVMPVPLNISGGQTLYLVAKSTFSGGTNVAYGSLYALRIS